MPYQVANQIHSLIFARVVFSVGGTPENEYIFMFFPNSSIKRLFPIRLLPLTTTRLADFFFNSKIIDQALSFCQQIQSYGAPFSQKTHITKMTNVDLVM